MLTKIDMIPSNTLEKGFFSTGNKNLSHNQYWNLSTETPKKLFFSAIKSLEENNEQIGEVVETA